MNLRLRATLVVALLACGGAPARPPPPATPEHAAVATDAALPDAPQLPAVPGVALKVTPADAEVAIDGVARGVASALPLVVALEPGVHQLVITRDGYAPYRVEFLVADKPETFAVRLERAR
jgi:glucose/arabinose dehydrogenase